MIKKIDGLTYEEWLAKETKPRKASLWGGEEFEFTPVLSEEIIGDGLQLMYFGTLDQRPYYWLVRIDSSSDLEDPDFDIDNIINLLEDEFGQAPYDFGIDEEDFNEMKENGDYDEYDSFEEFEKDCEYPNLYVSGYHFGCVVNFKFN